MTYVSSLVCGYRLPVPLVPQFYNFGAANHHFNPENDPRQAFLNTLLRISKGERVAEKSRKTQPCRAAGRSWLRLHPPAPKGDGRAPCVLTSSVGPQRGLARPSLRKAQEIQRIRQRQRGQNRLD